MKTRLTRQGSDLVLVIPEKIAAAANLDDRSDVNVDVRGPDVVITSEDEMTLEQMIDTITPENRHALIDFGPPVGKEIW